MGEVADFEKQLFKVSKRKFAQWQQIDLHNHSPTSFDYRGNKASALDDTAAVINKKGLGVVMFTDHACLPAADFVDGLRKRTPALIIRGTELNIAVDAMDKADEKVGKNIYFHLLIGFAPDVTPNEDWWLQKIYKDCGSHKIDCGGKELYAIQRGLDHLSEALKGSGAIVIPAHLHSRRDAYKSRSIDDVYQDETFLRFAKDYFTALEVSELSTATFFDGTRKETQYLHRSCIRSSDAHQAEELGNRVTYAQMEERTFSELRAALELPFRVCLEKPRVPQAYIVGAHVDGNFLKDNWVEFSPHCNVLIGVKGSGKTSVLECIRFALGVEVPKARTEEVQKHLDAILGPAGRVRVLVKRADGAKLLIERSLANRAFQVTFEDGTKHSFQNREGIQFPAHVLGWHEIEHVADDIQIRQLYLNTIAGEAELRRINEDVKTATSKIRQKHDLAVSKFDQLRTLESRIAHLEELRKGLQILTDQNLISLKSKYEQGISDNSSITVMADKLANAHPTLKQRVSDIVSGISATAFLGSEHLKDAIEKVDVAVNKLATAATEAGESLQNLGQRTAEEVAKAKEIAQAAFEKLASEYRESLAKLTSEQQQMLESHIKVAEETRQLNSLQSDFGELRSHLELIFAELVELCNLVWSKMDERTELRKKRIAELSAQVASSGVRLTVVPDAARWRFDMVASSSTRTWDVYRQIIEAHPEPIRFHQLLARGYEDLRIKITRSDYVDILHTPDLGPVLDAYEEDDLKIEFDPRIEAEGKIGNAHYKPIDQLSAGQRCTAVFPILLKLENAPLLIDQPEDNLDNRHIAKRVAESILENKRTRQMLFTSHNANLVVISDPENIIAYEASEGIGTIVQQGFLSNEKSSIMPAVLDILDGGAQALQLRARKYGHL